jgi:hypothetical protein
MQPPPREIHQTPFPVPEELKTSSSDEDSEAEIGTECSPLMSIQKRSRVMGYTMSHPYSELLEETFEVPEKVKV